MPWLEFPKKVINILTEEEEQFLIHKKTLQGKTNQQITKELSLIQMSLKGMPVVAVAKH